MNSRQFMGLIFGGPGIRSLKRLLSTSAAVRKAGPGKRNAQAWNKMSGRTTKESKDDKNLPNDPPDATADRHHNLKRPSTHLNTILQRDALKVEWQKPSTDAVYRWLPRDEVRIHKVYSEHKDQIGTFVVRPSGLSPFRRDPKWKGDIKETCIAELRALDGTPLLWIDHPRGIKTSRTAWYAVLRPTAHYNDPSLFQNVRLPRMGITSRQRVERIGIVFQERGTLPWNRDTILCEVHNGSLSPLGFNAIPIGVNKPPIFSVFPPEHHLGQLPPLSTSSKFVWQIGPNWIGMLYGKKSFGVALRVRGGFWDEVVNGPTGHFAALCPLTLPEAYDLHELPRPSIEHRAIFFAAAAIFGLDLGRY